MQVFRQDHDGLNRERTLVPRDTERRPQGAHVMHQRRGCPVSERDREEIGAPWNEVAPVSDHLRSLSRIALRSIRATSWLIPDCAALHPGYKLAYPGLRCAPSGLQAGLSRIALRSIRATSWPLALG